MQDLEPIKVEILESKTPNSEGLQSVEIPLCFNAIYYLQIVLLFFT